CTTNDTCANGVCAGTIAVVCGPSNDVCHADGVCDPGTGTCVNKPGPDGAPCDDGDKGTTSDAGSNGGGTGTAVTCPAQNDCQASGMCVPETGECKNENLADGRPCAEGTCEGGQCIALGSGSSSSGDGSSMPPPDAGIDVPPLTASGGCSCSAAGAEPDPRAIAALGRRDGGKLAWFAAMVAALVARRTRALRSRC